MSKACVAFEMVSATDAFSHLYSKCKIVRKYGDQFQGIPLYSLDSGERILFQCQSCGGYFLMQSSEFCGQDVSYRSDCFPVTGPEEAEALNRSLDGLEIEKSFPKRYLYQDEEGIPHWKQTCHEEQDDY